jgi:antitoxin HigA-1
METGKASTAFGSTINFESVSAGRRGRLMTSKSRTTTHEEELLPLITPGEFLVEEFLEPLGITGNALALALHVPSNRISAIIKGQRTISADTALRLAQYFGTTPEFWMNLQATYELDRAKREKLTEIQAQVPRRPASREEGEIRKRRSGD